MTEDELQRFVESLGRLNSETDELGEKLKQNYATQDTYTKAVSKTNDALDKEILSRLKSNAALLRGEQAYEQQLKSLGLVKNALGEFERTTVQMTDKQRKHIAEEQVYAERQKSRDEMRARYDKLMADKAGTLIQGLKNFGAGLDKTLFDSTKGQSKYGDAMSGFGDSIISATSNLGPLGKAAGLAAGGLLKLVGAAFKQQEQLNKAYENLSEVGAVDVSGIAGMFKNLQNAGFTVAELDKFQSIIKKASPNLATLGMTAADGAKVFADSMGAIKNTGVEKQLRMLGFNSESIAKTFADYQGLMGRQGFLQGKSTAEIAKRSSEYAQTLDELSKLTGESRDELQKRMEADANDIKFRLKIQELERSGQHDAADRLRKASALVGEFSEDTASGFREMVANNGKVVGEASAKLMLSTGNAARQIAMDLNAGKITAEQATLELTEAKAKQVERFREIGKLDADIMRELGLTVKDMDAISKFQGKSQEDINKVLDDRKKQASGELDGQRRAETQRQMTERNLEQSKDKLTNLVGNLMVGAFEKLLKVVNTVGKALADFAYVVSFGKIDIRDAFKSTEDMAEDLNALGKNIKNLDERIELAKRKPTIDKEITAQEGLLDLLRNNIEKETNTAKKTELQNKLVDAEKKMIELKQLKKTLDSTPSYNEAGLAAMQKKREEMAAKYNKQVKEYVAAGGETAKTPEEELADLKKEKTGEEKEIPVKDQDKQKNIDLITAALKKQGITDPKMIAATLGNVMKETGGYARSENLDYSKTSNARIREIFKTATQGKSDAEINTIKASPQKMSEMVYGSGSKLGKSMGNTEPGDGWKYRGRGFVQLTGKTNYASASKAIYNDNRLVENPDLVNDPSVAAEVSAWFMKRGQTSMAGKMGFNTQNLNQEQANLLATSIVQGKDVRTGSDYMKGELMAKVNTEAGKFTDYANASVKPPTRDDKTQMASTSPTEKDQRGSANKIPMAELGGLFSGPSSGYPVMLHGKELVIPMPNIGDITSAIENVQKQDLTNTTNPVTENKTANIDQFITIQTDLMNMIASKLDNLDSRLAKSNDIQENILTYSAA